MANAQPKPTALSAEQRRLLHSWLTEFERTWGEGRLAERVFQLPPPQDPLRRAALVGLIRIDLIRSWQNGCRASVESYLQAYPELGAADAAPVELVRAEFEQRRRLGEPGALEDLAARFPRLASDMQRWVAKPKLPRAASETISAHDRATAEAQPPAKLEDLPAPPRTLPERFGRYHILKTLGKGGMGTVYLAHDTQLDRQVALKVPHLETDGARVLERFYREARAAATIHHSNLCPVYDVGEINGTPYLTMAYVEGKSLAAFVAARPLSPRQSALLVRKLALSLQEAHKKGVIHRDLKPSNVMIDKRGEPIIMDFGLARRARKGDPRLTQQGSVLGTPAYMPPEQVNGNIDAMGPACDIYSLGVILYELLAGRLPFEGDVMAMLAQVLLDEPPPPSALRPGLDPELEAICLKAMAKKADNRYASMAELHDALGAYVRGSGAPEAGKEASPPLLEVPPSSAPVPTLQEAEPATRSAKSWSRKWPWFAGSGAVAGLLLVGILLFASADGGATLEIKLDDPEAVVSLDGSEISREKLDQPISLSPGKHTVSVARATGEETQQFTLERGEKRVVVFRLEKPRPAPAPAPAPMLTRGAPGGQPATPPTPPLPPPQTPGEKLKRRRPTVLVAEEVQATFVRAQIPRMRFTFNQDGSIAKVWVLSNGGPVLPGGPGMRGRPGMLGRPGAAAPQEKIELVPLAQAGNRVPATEPLGVRMVVVAASFPFKKQVEEFRSQLLLPNHGAVLGELVRDKDGQDRPSFRFTGLVIERAIMDRDGKPGPWERLLGKIDPNETVQRRAYDLDKAYTDLILQLPPAQRFEKEDPKLQPVLDAGRGLVKSLPAQYAGKQYPKLEANLPTIQETIRKLAEQVPPRNLPNFNPFDAPPMKPGPRGVPPAGPKPPQPFLKETPLDHCLIRFLDLNVEPGKVYRYRFKVKMANPLSATGGDLLSAWTTVPQTVVIPPDEFLYAVDQAKIAPKLKIRPGDTPEPNQTIFQIQRWVETYTGSGDRQVGDWLVATRFFVQRGEYVRTPPSFTLEIPIHQLGNPQLTLDSRRAPRQRGLTTFVPLQFGDEAILVDFEGDKERGPYFRTETNGEKTITTRIMDKGATEVLILRPDGKLIARNSVTDAADPARIKRYEDYRERVKEAKNGPKKPDNKLFD